MLADISIDDDIFGDLSNDSNDDIPSDDEIPPSTLESHKKIVAIATSSGTMASGQLNNDSCDIYESLRRTCLKNFHESDYFLKSGDLFQPSLPLLELSKESLYTQDEKCKTMEHFFKTLEYEIQKMKAEHLAYKDKISRRSVLPGSDLNERDMEKIMFRLASLESLEDKLKCKRAETLEKITKVRECLLKKEFSQLSHFPATMAKFENFYRTLRISHTSPNPITSGIIKESAFPDESTLKSEFSLCYSRFFRQAFKFTVNGVDDHVNKAVKLLDNFKKFYNETNVIMANSKIPPEDKVTQIMQIMHTYNGPKDFEDAHSFDKFSILKFEKARPVSVPDDLNRSSLQEMPKLTSLFPEKPSGSSTPKKVSTPQKPTFLGLPLASTSRERFLHFIITNFNLFL